MPTKTVSDYILEVLTPVYGVATGEGPDAGSVQELLKRWWSGEGNSGNPTNQKLFDRYTAAGAVGASLQDKALDFWGRGLLKSGVYLPGTSGNYISTPDSTLNSITGDLDVRIYLKMADWTPSANQTFIAKYGTGTPQRVWRVWSSATTGRIAYAFSADGVTPITYTPVVDMGWADGSAHWVRFTHDVDNGAGGHTIVYYTSDDGLTWTQRATTTNLGITGVISLFDSTSPLELGSFNTGVSELLNGTIYYAEVRDGIDGRIVAKFDSSTIQKTGAQLPANVNGWSVNGSAVRRIDDYVQFTGAASNYLSYPDTVANSVTGDVEIVAKIAPDDWTPAAIQQIVNKEIPTTQRSYGLRLNTAGALVFRFALATDGSVADERGSNANLSALANGAVKWVKGNRTASTGVCRFYTSDDGVNWTQLGTDITGGAAGALFDSTSPIEIGARSASNDMFAGKVYYAEVRNGINGPVVASFDARDITTPWTMNGSGWSYEASSFVEKPEVALDLPGTSGNYVSTPDSAVLSITGDIDIRAQAVLDNWATTTRMCFVGKWTGSRGYALLTGFSAPKLGIFISRDGVETLQTESSANIPFTAGQIGWVRVTRASASGEVKFYTSLDGITWTQLGTTQSTTAGAIFDSTAALNIGGRNDGTSDLLAGAIHYAEVRNGIDGPIVARFDASAVCKTGTRLPASTTQQPGYPAANLLTPQQASLEDGTTTGYTAESNTTIANTAAQALDGTKSLEMTAIAGGAIGARTGSGTSGTPIILGKSYNAGASLRAATAARGSHVCINWYTAAGAYISTTCTSLVADSTSGWTAHTLTALGPATAAYGVCIPRVGDAGVAIAEVHYVDRVSIVETPTPWTINGSAWSWVSV